MERYSDLYDEGSGLEVVHVAEVLDYLGEYFVLYFSIEDIRWTNRSYVRYLPNELNENSIKGRTEFLKDQK